ncbi:TetR family transcriptional regulator [Desulfobulbus sp. Tol-SR]|jgi:AcrR family transcriptional regulator|nr:TetR family transcriptional regulator [Desulfobulbus sp. Tol-SR]
MDQFIGKGGKREEIMELSVPLFAVFGYDGVSMRDVAAVCGLTPAALYYHFSHKEDLYLEVVAHAFREKSAALLIKLKDSDSPWVQLENFITNLAHLAAKDEDFLRLMQWVRLDSEEMRQQKLVTHVFKDLFLAVHALVAKLNSRYDPYMLSMSIIHLVLIPFEGKKIRKFMPGYRPEHDQPDVLARHVIDLLRMGLFEYRTSD